MSGEKFFLNTIAPLSALTAKVSLFEEIIASSPLFITSVLKNKLLGFISNDLLSNFFIVKKFLSLKEVFPSNHNFTLTMPSVDPVRKTDPAMEPFIFEGGSFEKAIDSRKKAIVDLSRLSKKKGEDTDKKEILKILKKYNLVELKQDFNDDVRYFANDHLYDVYFEHDYEDFKLPNFPGRGPRTNDNYFLVKTRIGKNILEFSI